MRTVHGFFACCGAMFLSSLPAFGQSSSDLFQGAAIGSTSGTLGASPDGLFGGPGFGGGELGNTLFSGNTVDPLVGTGQVNFVEFTVANGPVTVTSIAAYFGQDGEVPGSNRSVLDFTLIADTDGTPGFQPTDAFVTSPPVVYVGNTATVTLPFLATASSFRLELDPFNSGPDAGVRVLEFDAVPEPASLALLAPAAAAAFARPRQRRLDRARRD